MEEGVIIGGYVYPPASEEAILAGLKELSRSPVLDEQIKERLNELIQRFHSGKAETDDSGLTRELLLQIRQKKESLEQQREYLNKKYSITDQLKKVEALIFASPPDSVDKESTTAQFIGDLILGQYTSLIANIKSLEEQKNALNEEYKIEELLHGNTLAAIEIGRPIIGQYNDLAEGVESLGGISALECMAGGD